MGEDSSRDSKSVYARLAVPGAAATDHIRSKRIDAIRAIAALGVLASHAPKLGEGGYSSDSALLVGRLASGVWLFFAVSGFLIAGPFLRALVDGRSLPSPRRYAVRRAARILPAYWVALAAILILATGGTIAHWWQLPVHGLLLHTLVPGEPQKLYFVAWTLGLEMIFYALVPVVAYLAWRYTRGRPADAAKVLTAILWFWILTFVAQILLGLAYHRPGTEPGMLQVVRSLGALGNFCPGMLAYLAAREGVGRWSRAYRAIARQPLMSLAFAFVCIYTGREIHWQTDWFASAIQRPLMGIGSGLILVAVLEGQWLRRTIEVLAPIGLISYGVYLWHWVVLATIEHHGLHPVSTSDEIGTLGQVLLLLVLTLPLALASWLLVERPLLQRTTWWERRRGLVARPAPATGE
jgi:acetyltransferase